MNEPVGKNTLLTWHYGSWLRMHVFAEDLASYLKLALSADVQYVSVDSTELLYSMLHPV